MEKLIKEIKGFIRARDWEQFHSSKNLAMALSVEASEIVEIFQWKEPGYKLNDVERESLKQEIGDTFIYLLELADKYGIDPLEAARQKISLNNKKYPVEKVRGKAKKYTEYN